MRAWLARFGTPQRPNRRETLVLAAIGAAVVAAALVTLFFIYVLPSPE